MVKSSQVIVELLLLQLINMLLQHTLVVKCMTVLFDELSVQGAASHAALHMKRAHAESTCREHMQRAHWAKHISAGLLS